MHALQSAIAKVRNPFQNPIAFSQFVINKCKNHRTFQADDFLLSRSTFVLSQPVCLVIPTHGGDEIQHAQCHDHP